MKYWFKAKKYGWGWYPSTWEGWVVFGIFIIFNFYQFININSENYSGSDILINYAPLLIASLFILIAFCFITGEQPRWRWGDKKK